MKWIRHILPAITATHRFFFRFSSGGLGASVFGWRFLQLEHVGRKSGLPRKTPLLYVEDEGRFIVAGSNAGQDRHPAWWLNLEAHPDAVVSAAGERVEVRARLAAPQEEIRLWALMQQSYRWFEEYRAGTERDIPLVILEPLRARSHPVAQGRAGTLRSVEVRHRFNAPPQAVWDVYSDHARWSEWAGTPGSHLVVKGHPDPNGVGAVRGFVGGMREEILSFEPPKSMTYTVVAGFFPVKDHEGEVVFEADDTGDGVGTLVIWRCRFRSKIPGLGGLLERIVTATFRRGLAGLERHSFS